MRSIFNLIFFAGSGDKEKSGVNNIKEKNSGTNFNCPRDKLDNQGLGVRGSDTADGSTNYADFVVTIDFDVITRGGVGTATREKVTLGCGKTAISGGCVNTGKVGYKAGTASATRFAGVAAATIGINSGGGSKRVLRRTNIRNRRIITAGKDGVAQAGAAVHIGTTESVITTSGAAGIVRVAKVIASGRSRAGRKETEEDGKEE
jgi:hypothetical protein